jgi:oligopeptide transport system substrate-binding protein
MRSRSNRSRGGNHFLPIALVLALVGVLAAGGAGLEPGKGPSADGAAGEAPATAPTGPKLTLALGEAPGSLDPAFATDPTARNLVGNLMDPLVMLGDDAEPVPSLASAWDIEDGGRRVTFRLRANGRWTNGDPVTAHDFEYAWKRVLAPALDSPHAERLFAIEGAAAYHRCGRLSCARLARAVGVEAVGDHELAVRLTKPRPAFVAETADAAFLPVHRATVERFGDDWTAPDTIVTNGPFTLARIGESFVSLVKDPRWRAASRVELGRVDGLVIPDATARVNAFDAGQVVALTGSGLPATDMPALRERREYAAYPALATYLYAFNLTAIPNVHQRRAMALAVDRRAIVENVTQGGEVPATRFTPEGAALADAAPPSPWLPEDGDVGRAREELEEAENVTRRVTLVHLDEPGKRQLALAVRDAWRQIGIEARVRARDPEGQVEVPGRLATTAADVYEVDLRYPSPDPAAGLDLWSCRIDVDTSDLCDPRYDRLLERARGQTDPVMRRLFYASVEDLLSGEEGAFPAVPLFWRTYTNLESLDVADTFTIDPLGQIDLAAVRVR